MGQAKLRPNRVQEAIEKKQQEEKERIERRRNMPKPSHKTYATLAMLVGLSVGV